MGNAVPRFQAFLAVHPGLEAAFGTNHRIICEIAEQFQEVGKISEKQVALVMKIHREAQERAAARALEKHVAAPLGRQTFTGTVLAVKAHEGRFGTSVKMTVEVQTENGTWLAWGTKPAAMHVEKGALVEVTATLEAGREAYFVFMKRPRAKVLVAVEATLKEPAGLWVPLPEFEMEGATIREMEPPAAVLEAA